MGHTSDRLVIWGAGGHGKVVLDVAREAADFRDIVFLDDDATRAGTSFCGCTVAGGSRELGRFAGSSFVIAVGHNRVRAQCFARALESGLHAATLIHPSAVVSTSARLAPGTVVMPGVVVNAEAEIGRNGILNTGCVIEHECRIHDHVHISPRAVLGGNVTVGAYAHVGIGATILPGACVGENAVVGGGALVLKEAPADSTVVGVPSRILVKS